MSEYEQRPNGDEDDSFLPSAWLPPANSSLEQGSAEPEDDDDRIVMPDETAQINRLDASQLAPVTQDPNDEEYVPEGKAAGLAPALNFAVADTSATLPIVYDAPVQTVAVMPPAKTEQITCPECGRVSMVTLTRRESVDFCESCDYPLFWTPNRILLDSSGLYDDSLRRLPGTVGRVSVTSFPCPHCAEPNQVTAIDCVRCGLPLRPVHFEPRPEPVYLPTYEPEPEPETGLPWWVYVLVATLIMATVVFILALNGNFET